MLVTKVYFYLVLCLVVLPEMKWSNNKHSALTILHSVFHYDLFIIFDSNHAALDGIHKSVHLSKKPIWGQSHLFDKWRSINDCQRQFTCLPCINFDFHSSVCSWPDFTTLRVLKHRSFKLSQSINQSNKQSNARKSPILYCHNKRAANRLSGDSLRQPLPSLRCHESGSSAPSQKLDHALGIFPDRFSPTVIFRMHMPVKE